MKKAILVLSFMLMCSVAVGIAQGKKEKPKEITITGVITDVKCHLNGMAADMEGEHLQCAIDCIKGGLPVGVVEEKTDNLYTLIPAKGMKGANEDLVKYVEKKVKLTGSMKEAGGTKMFFYTRVEEVK